MNEPVYHNGYWYHRSNEKNLFKGVDEEIDHIEHNEKEIWNKIKESLREIAEEVLNDDEQDIRRTLQNEQ